MERIMMTYVMSDMHGEYDKYIAMLEKIHFSDSDKMYILGDVVDRGNKPVEILLDMRGRSNVYPIMGNHDKMAIDTLEWLLREVTDETLEQNLSREKMYKLAIWRMNGSQTTIDGFARIPKEERQSLLDYMKSFAPYKVVNIAGKTFILVHAGLGHFSRDKSLDDYSLQDLAFVRFNYSVQYFGGDVYIITGHTPTITITYKAEIYHSCNNICIDCGAVFPSGRLACLRLDDMKEYYVD